MSIIVIIFILYLNIEQSIISTTIILPLSINKISYLHELNEEVLIIDSEKNNEFLLLSKENEIKDFLKKLDTNENYIVSLQFIPNF